MSAKSSDVRRVQRVLARTAIMAALAAALAACGGGGGDGDKHASSGLPGGGGDNPSTVPAGLLETTPGNTGDATDNVVPLQLGDALGGNGQSLDPPLSSEARRVGKEGVRTCKFRG